MEFLQINDPITSFSGTETLASYSRKRTLNLAYMSSNQPPGYRGHVKYHYNFKKVLRNVQLGQFRITIFQ